MIFRFLSRSCRTGGVFMRACLLPYQAPIESRPLDLVEIPKPVPKAGEILIKVSACGVCRTDLHVTEGDLKSCLIPVIPGHQIVGTIDNVGSSETNLSPGRRVGVAWL